MTRTYDVVDDDPLHGWSGPRDYWSTSNIGEAAPGVQTPLSATVWWPVLEDSIREMGYRVGYFTEAERRTPREMDKRFVRLFYGRFASSVRLFAIMGDRMPGTTGPAAVESLFGRVPDDIEFEPTRRYYPRIAWRLLQVYRTVPGQLESMTPEYATWWQDSVRRVGGLDRTDVADLFRQALERLHDAVHLQHLAVLGIVAPSLAFLDDIGRRTGVPEAAALATATGNAEMAVVCDLWRASRNELSLDEILARYGYHGPLEGELSTTVWRENDSSLRRMIAHYADRDDAENPLRGEADRHVEHGAIVDKVLAATPRWRRPLVAWMLGHARRNLPLRGVAKCSFVQAFDVMRACARRLGDLLVAEGALDSADDVFYLTVDELTRTFPDDAQAIVTDRRGRRSSYEGLVISGDWKGMPSTESVRTVDDRAATEVRVDGIGVSRGVAEGTARVVLEPDFTDIEPGEILVAPTTDPSWSSVMFLSAAIVVDIGGPLSHAAVVARELDVPCVVNTRTGTRVVRTGDRVRVDGSTGVVEVLERADHG